MPTLSKKAGDMPASPIRKLVPYSLKAEREGVHVYHLNIGQPDIKTPRVGIEALQSYKDNPIAYGLSAGNISFREKLASTYMSMGIQLDAGDILITTGGSEAIRFGVDVCCDPLDEIIIPEPFYANYNGFLSASNAKIVPLTCRVDDDYALPSMAEIESLITPKTKAIFLCNPNNPTGYVYSKEELKSVRDLVLKHDLFLFTDEVYSDFCYEGEFTSALSLEGLDEHLVVFDSMSKRYSACGIRIGSLITRSTSFMNAALKLAQARLCPPMLGQVVAEAALSAPRQYLHDVHDEYKARRDIVVAALRSMDGVYCPNPRGAFYVQPRIPVDDCERFAQWLLEDFRKENATVMVSPGSGFYATPGKGKNEIRIAYVLNADDLHRSMEILKEALDVYPGRINKL